MNLFDSTLLQLRPSRPLSRTSLTHTRTTPFAFSNYIHRLSTANAPAPPPQPLFAAVDYLIQSCGLTSDQTLRASKYIDHLKSLDKPNVVLRFLRQIRFREPDIRTAVSRDSRILCSSVEKNYRPNAEKLMEIGFSVDDISTMVSRYPWVFVSDVKPKIDFWMRALCSTENISMVLKVQTKVLCVSLEKDLKCWRYFRSADDLVKVNMALRTPRPF